MKRKGEKTILAAIVLIFCLIGPRILSAGTAKEDTMMLENLRKMRMRQQQEEIVIRETRFVQVDRQQHCTPAQQTRQRIRDADAASGKTSYENININAGHDEINVTGNNGTINSDVNVNIINQGRERECL